ncbi:bifunctional diaminohydroxyphosphoribosylaminopyrimidine deaminase/5-amino-6-(5-phosphoribosylamino)uracil reductase RibD [Paragemmobacter straminiformis]|uniref:Riboflavin biosynthesis protein RibD n=1 Tax=Paragemmobacter straminiformis TaxID=2045119 RepID=A0A842I3F8_9RHOB|nr:bifunctional diaminohydroxyphosphoribosylaminopyrimidine deaminase/5-amino-6-(5-phosphoribosylamino)uracil reductase RibD [Gemmobacter straminiformis]MBC2833987.1 bifunctional diaminohydroxyphosphoribosylaminopyrimidine deaminase/5-amino-6-(5-phosphoribosylamino)uracil reductase RibD [Gemmobacter straminiformis]
MKHALALAARGLGRTWPNPAVGCVIVAGGRVVGRGHTQAGGRPHAERMALAQAGDAARGATAYVTLEPCSHHGKTSPCAEALIAAGIARVVSAQTDPDPRVSGRGHALLRAAGIAVTEGVCEAEARALQAGFLKRVTQGLPFVTLKLAATLDGRIATASGESRWITGPVARRAVHLMRMTHDAVLTSSATALADDPDLTVRDLGSSHQPLRVLLDSQLKHRPDSRLGRTARETPVWLLHTAAAPDTARQAWQATGARLSGISANGPHIDLSAAFHHLADQGLTRILIEAGGRFAAALIRANLVDELALFSAGALIGSEGIPVLGPLGLTALAEAPRPRLVTTETCGPDILTRWRF